MKEKTSKIVTLTGLGIAVISTVLAIFFAMRIPDTVKNLTDLVNYEAETHATVSPFFDITYWTLVILIALSIAAILVFLIVKLAKRFANEKGYLVKFLIILGVCAAVVVVSILLSTGTDVNAAKLELIDKDVETATSISKLIGAACYMVYILVAGAAATIVYSEIAKSLKK